MISFASFKNWILHFLQVQLFVTLFSLPILIWWGLPFSWMTFVGNLIFSPFLTLFLLLSTIIFFFELMHIPNSFFILLLELTTKLWCSINKLGSSSWLIGYAKPHPLFLMMIPVSACLIIQHRALYSVSRRIIALSCLLILVICTLIVLRPNNTFISIPCSTGALTIIHQEHETIIIDPGFLSRHANASSWIEYTLIPTVIKEVGTTTIDHFIVLHPSKRVFQALAHACSLVPIKKVYLPTWSGTVPKKIWRTFFEMRETVTRNNSSLIRITKEPITLGNSNFTIYPQQQNIKKTNICFPLIHIEGSIENKKIVILPAHSQKIKKE